MFVIGITGGTGSGKTSALRALQSLGALVVDCDAVYHELLSGSKRMKTELEARFEGVLKNGEIDRRRLGEIVFSDPLALLDLNAITHKYVLEETERRLADWEHQGGELAAVDAIALIECGLGERCNAVVWVTAPREERIRRIMTRDSISREQAERRVSAQKPDSFFEKNCGFILDSGNNTTEEFEKKCKVFFAEIIGGRLNAR